MPEESILRGQRIEPVKLERAKELRREMTPEERMLWSALRTNRLRGWHFRRQQPVAGFILDFYCHAAKLCIEVDGGIHDERHEYDSARDAVLSAHGIRVLRVSNEAIHHSFASVVAQVEDLCAQPIASHDERPLDDPFPRGKGVGG